MTGEKESLDRAERLHTAMLVGYQLDRIAERLERRRQREVWFAVVLALGGAAAGIVAAGVLVTMGVEFTLQAVLGWAVGAWTGAVLGLAGAATRAAVEIRAAAAGQAPVKDAESD